MHEVLASVNFDNGSMFIVSYRCRQSSINVNTDGFFPPANSFRTPCVPKCFLKLSSDKKYASLNYAPTSPPTCPAKTEKSAHYHRRRAYWLTNSTVGIINYVQIQLNYTILLAIQLANWRIKLAKILICLSNSVKSRIIMHFLNGWDTMLHA